jgi:hypothetical protein
MERGRGVAIGLVVLLLVGSGAAQGQAPAAAAGAADAPPRFLKAEGVDLTCYPARLHASEGRWSFLLRGKGTLAVESAALVIGDARIPATRIAYPTPNAAIVDVQYPQQTPGGSAELVLSGADPVREVARFRNEVAAWPELPPVRRQRALVRLQLRPWVIFYPLHGSELKDRGLAELAGDESFLAVLRDLGLERIRKAISRYAEDDSVHWNETYQREDMLGGDLLRSYLLDIDPQRSELAYKEIVLAFPQVQMAFINEDKSK